MRRGLIAWSEAEVPAATLAQRLQRFRREMEVDSLDAALLYTNIVRPAAVSHLTQFVPYWNEAALVVLPDGAPILTAAFSKRVAGWIADVSHGAEVVAAPNVARSVLDILARGRGRPKRLGVVELDSLPAAVLQPLAAAIGKATFIDATASFARARHPADAAEIALATRAAAMAQAALDDAVAAEPRDTTTLAARIEKSGREAGAEEIVVYCAPDLAADFRLRRVEDQTALGLHYAIVLSIAYKGVWTRLGRSVTSLDPAPQTWPVAEDWFAHACAALAPGRPALAAPPAGMTFASWSIEAARGSYPLAPIAGSAHPDPRDIVAGTPAVLNVRLVTADGPWLRTEAVIIGAPLRPH